MKLAVEVTRAVVVNGHGTDTVYLETEFPAPYPDCLDKGKLTFNLSTTKGWGWWYLQDELGVPEQDIVWIDATGKHPNPPAERPEDYLLKSRIKITVADHTTTPGARYIKDGEHSGQWFREKYLEPLFVDGSDNRTIEIDFNNVEGYPPSFLDEAIGGLVRKLGSGCVNRLRLVHDQYPELLSEIWDIIAIETVAALDDLQK